MGRIGPEIGGRSGIPDSIISGLPGYKSAEGHAGGSGGLLPETGLGGKAPGLQIGELAELEKLQKLEMAAAGQKLLEAVAKKNTETLLAMGAEPEEETVSQKAQEQRAERAEDEASLSADSRAAALKEKAAALFRSALEESVSEKLRNLEGWEPSGAAALESEIAQLRELYRGLVAEILKLPGDMQERQAQQLNAAMVEAVQRLAEGKYPNLAGLFSLAGEEDSVRVLQAAVFRMITGKIIAPEVFGGYAARAGVFLRGRAGQESIENFLLDTGTPERAGRHGGQAFGEPGQLKQEGLSSGAARSPAGEAVPAAGAHRSAGTAGLGPQGRAAQAQTAVKEAGVLYGKASGEGILTDAGYREQVRLSERFTPQMPGGQGLPEAAAGRLREKALTAADMARAEKFCSYFRQGGNLMENPRLTAHNEELLGFLMAQNGMKGELFSEYAGVGREMGRSIRDVLEKLSRYYLNQAQEECDLEEGRAELFRFDGKAVRRVYYQVMQVFHRMKKPQRAIEEGLRRAAEEFCSKQEKAENKKKKRYREDAGFFEKALFGKSRKRQWEDARRELEKDWGEFLKSMGQQGNEFLQLVFANYSPWGAQVEPEDAVRGRTPFHPLLLVFIMAAVLLLLWMTVIR